MSYALTGLNPGTQYQVRIRTICGTTSIASSNSALLTFTTANATSYCPSVGTNAANHYIQTVAMGSYANTSGNNNGYGNFTATTWTVSKGTLYGLAITPNHIRNTNLVCYKVWVDWNRDNDFSDASELVAMRTISSRSPFMIDMNIPVTAMNGTTRMRVSFSGDNCVNACTPSFALGEVEDYTLNIVSPAAAREVPLADEMIKVFPNPIKDEVSILTNTGAKISHISVWDITAKLVSQTQNIATTQTTLHLSTLLSGVYVLEIEMENGEKIYRKVIKD